MKRIYEALLDRFSVKTLRLICLIVLAAAGIVVGTDVVRGGAASFGGQEVVEVHITPDGLLRAISRVSITRCPANVTYIPIHIPQGGAHLEAVIVGGRSVPFKSSEDLAESTPNTYYAMPSLPEKAFRDAVVEITWSIPLERIRTESGILEFPLRSVVPTKSFAVNVVIDEGAPYRFGGKFSGANDFNLFWVKRDRYFGGAMGSCRIELVPIGS